MPSPHACWESARPHWEAVVADMWTSSPKLGVDGRHHPLDSRTRVRREGCELLATLVRRIRAKRTLEVGCAYGFSTLYMAAALAEVGGLKHVSIDPFQDRRWSGIGRHAIMRAGLSTIHELIPALSDLALPMLHQQGLRFDLAFIDGDHRFDAIIADIRNVGRLLGPGGVLVLDDTWMRSTRTAMGWLERNLPYRPIAHGHNLAVYQKQAEDQRPWDHFVPFAVATEQESG